MNGDRDDEELFARANPVPDPAAGFDPASPRGERLYERILAGEIGSPLLRRRRRRLLVVPAAVAAVAVLAAAGYLATREPSRVLQVGCYEEASLGAATVVVRAEEGEALAVCQDAWRDGGFGRPQEPPPLQRCVLASGAVGVFPGEDAAVCGRLGRPVAEPRDEPPPSTNGPPPPAPGAVGRLRDRLVGAALGARCLDPGAARRLAEDELRRQRLEGWAVRVGPGASGGGFDAERPCATFDVDEARATVVLVPAPPDPG